MRHIHALLTRPCCTLSPTTHHAAATQYPDPANYRTLKLKHATSANRWVTPLGGIRPWGLSDNTMLIFYDEEDLFQRIGFDLILNPYAPSPSPHAHAHTRMLMFMRYL